MQERIARRRVNRLWKLLGPLGIDGMLITSPENIRYLCGFSGSEAVLVVSRTGTVFLTDGRYTTQARQEVCGCELLTFQDIFPAIARAASHLGVQRLGYESRHMTVATRESLARHLPGVELIACADQLDPLRTVKDATEIKLLKNAARLAARALETVLPLIRPGVREIDIAVELEHCIRRSGAGIAFPTIIASGPRAALPHGIASPRVIQAGDLVTVDYGARYQGYCSDETCTFVVGRASEKQRRIYDTVRRAQYRAIKAVGEGVALKSIDRAARRHIERTGLGDQFPHGTGHGLGLCVHEYPSVTGRSSASACRGMVFTIEPGVYLPEWGGVRIEDTVVVTGDGCELITCSDKRLRELG